MNRLDKLLKLKGKKILITGASGYLGQEIVSALYDLNVSLYVTDVSLGALSVFNKKKYSKIIKIPCDLSKETERKTFFQQILKIFQFQLNLLNYQINIFDNQCLSNQY